MVKETPYPQVPPQQPQPVFSDHTYYNGGQMYGTNAKTRSSSLQIGRKIKATFYCTVLFLILSYHGTYRALNNVISTFMNNNFQAVNEHGLPTIKGMFVHGVIYFIIAFFVIGAV